MVADAKDEKGTDMAKPAANEFLLSYQNLRRLIGVLGAALPLTVMIGGVLAGYEIQDSVSAYYFTNMRDLFVGLLALTGAFLICYRGFDWKDDWATNFSGACALAAATFPMDCQELRIVRCDATTRVGTFERLSGTSGTIHLLSAVLLFISLALISLLLFTKTDQVNPTPEKKLRNAIYRLCGWGMLAALGVFAILHVPALASFAPQRLILYVEIVCLALFGISWLTKGEIPPVADKQPAPVPARPAV
jgi:hypothetical protein